MKIIYANKEIEKTIENIKASKILDNKIKKKLAKIIDYLKDIDSFKEAYALKLYDLHLLKGDRKSEWSMYIDLQYRLIFLLCDDNEMPIKNGDWTKLASTIKIIMIKEVSKHYAK